MYLVDMYNTVGIPTAALPAAFKPAPQNLDGPPLLEVKEQVV